MGLAAQGRGKGVLGGVKAGFGGAKAGPRPPPRRKPSPRIMTHPHSTTKLDST